MTYAGNARIGRNSQFLLNNGWRLINRLLPNDSKAWHHPAHQPDAPYSYFTTASAVAHQKRLDRIGTCNCYAETD